jgi:hypothetical protein
MLAKPKGRAAALAALGLMLAVLAGGCAWKRLGDPDAEFAKQVYAFNKQVMVFMVGLEKKLLECGIKKPSDIDPSKPCLDASYKENREFYLQTAPLGLAGLRLRAGANPPNAKTIAWIDELQSLLEELRAQHQKGMLVPRYVEKKRRVINAAFVQILLRERAKAIAQSKPGKR